MPKIPRFEQPAQLPGDVSGVPINPGAFGNEGRGAEAFGKGIQDVGSYAYDIAKKRKDANDLSFATEERQKIIRDSHKFASEELMYQKDGYMMETRMENNQRVIVRDAQGNPNLTEKTYSQHVREDIASRYADTQDRAANETQRKLFVENSRPVLDSLGAEADSTTRKAIATAYKTTQEKSLDQNSDLMIRFPDAKNALELMRGAKIAADAGIGNQITAEEAQALKDRIATELPTAINRGYENAGRPEIPYALMLGAAAKAEGKDLPISAEDNIEVSIDEAMQNATSPKQLEELQKAQKSGAKSIKVPTKTYLDMVGMNLDGAHELYRDMPPKELAAEVLRFKALINKKQKGNWSGLHTENGELASSIINGIDKEILKPQIRDHLKSVSSNSAIPAQDAARMEINLFSKLGAREAIESVRDMNRNKRPGLNDLMRISKEGADKQLENWISENKQLSPDQLRALKSPALGQDIIAGDARYLTSLYKQIDAEMKKDSMAYVMSLDKNLKKASDASMGSGSFSIASKQIQITNGLQKMRDLGMPNSWWRYMSDGERSQWHERFKGTQNGDGDNTMLEKFSNTFGKYSERAFYEMAGKDEKMRDLYQVLQLPNRQDRVDAVTAMRVGKETHELFSKREKGAQKELDASITKSMDPLRAAYTASDRGGGGVSLFASRMGLVEKMAKKAMVDNPNLSSDDATADAMKKIQIGTPYYYKNSAFVIPPTTDDKMRAQDAPLIQKYVQRNVDKKFLEEIHLQPPKSWVDARQELGKVTSIDKPFATGSKVIPLTKEELLSDYYDDLERRGLGWVMSGDGRNLVLVVNPSKTEVNRGQTKVMKQDGQSEIRVPFDSITNKKLGTPGLKRAETELNALIGETPFTNEPE